ncbi:hypothetical protein scyTo_0015195 [Scyliorhinus torazame]|uniref:Uncharacterized protein n=1 Tax=Scyliorhinus torazame TaxID=75743 RepID=A0A401P4S8_SCYTO|nr:hypothetical protein [Scyliorhinus torazame]
MIHRCLSSRLSEKWRDIFFLPDSNRGPSCLTKKDCTDITEEDKKTFNARERTKNDVKVLPPCEEEAMEILGEQGGQSVADVRLD